MLRTERIWIKNDCSAHCHLAKNLYNETNYLIRQEFIKNRKWLRYNDLYHMLKDSDNYKQLPAKTAQHVIQNVDENWKSFFQSIKNLKVHPEKYQQRPGLPRYLRKDGEFVLRFDYQQVRIKDGKLRFPKKINMEVKTRIKNLKEVRIVPKGIGYWIEIVYDRIIKKANVNKQKALMIDIGVRNLVTMADNIGNQPIVIKGGVVKSINQYYNKKKAHLRSMYDIQGLKHQTRQEQQLSIKRNNKINDDMHKTSKWIVDYCIKHKIGTIIIGHNDLWKQRIDIGKRNNQSFVSIPFYKLIYQVQYKSEDVGIDVYLKDESHTSKCSFLDNEPVEHHNNYIGRRVKRGIFKSANGIKINADVNACYNLFKKAVLKGLRLDEIEGVWLHPVRHII